MRIVALVALYAHEVFISCAAQQFCEKNIAAELLAYCLVLSNYNFKGLKLTADESHVLYRETLRYKCLWDAIEWSGQTSE